MTEPKAATYRLVESTTLHAGFLTLDRILVDVVTRSGERRRYGREVELQRDGAAVLAFDPVRREAVLVRQLRVPLAVAGDADAYLLETIAGLLDKPGEDAAETARREAMEEAGLKLDDLDLVGRPFPAPGTSTQRVHLFLAEVDLSTARHGDGGGADEENEDIEVVTLSLAHLAAMADAGELFDMKTLALVQTLRLRRPELFDQRT